VRSVQHQIVSTPMPFPWFPFPFRLYLVLSSCFGFVYGFTGIGERQCCNSLAADGDEMHSINQSINQSI